MGQRRLALVAGVVLAILSERGLPSCQGLATPPMWPLSPEQRRKEQRIATHRDRGEQFVKAILTHPFETLPNHKPTDASGAGEEGCTPGGEMRLWRNIPDLYTGTPLNIVLRSIDEPFWQSCIDTIEISNPEDPYRVCAMGTPGIGKSFTTPLLLRMLLLKGCTVVYIRRSIDQSSWFYEFVPRQETGGGLAATVNVYPEESNKSYFPSLRVQSNYYVVDPGSSKENCSPDEFFEAHVIIISSPIPEHWGAHKFLDRNTGVGLCHYYPIWNYSDLSCGLDYFSAVVRLSPQQLAERYRQVGGVPGHLFADTEEYYNILEAQDDAVAAIEPEEALRIVRGTVYPIGHLKSGKLMSAVVGIESSDNKFGKFKVKKGVPISTAVAETLSSILSQYPDALE